MKLRKANWIAAGGIAAALALTPALGLCQTTTTTEVYSPNVTTSRTTTTVTTAPAVNPDDPIQFPPAQVGMNPTSHEGNFKAAFVDQQIALAKARGQDTSAAESQEIMGQADLREGLNKEAAQHFDSALRAVGVIPAVPGDNPGEATSYHAPMP